MSTTPEAFDPGALDSSALDRELRAGAARWRKWRRALRRGVIDDAPFGASQRFGKTLYDWVRGLPEDFPLRRPLSRWVYRLAEQRIDAVWLAQEAVLVRQEQHPIREPIEGRYTLAEMTRAALAGPHRGHWHVARLQTSSKLAAHRALLWQRRQEVAVRMGHATPDEIELPSPDIYLQADQWLLETQAATFDRVGPGFGAYVDSALAEGAAEGWPARLSQDTLAGLWGHPDWFRGLVVSVDPLPERLAPSSFLRALARLGAAWQLSLAAGRAPFALAEDPGGLPAWTEGALFALTACRKPFLRKQLGLSREQARDHERRLLAAVTQWIRLVAVRCLLRRAALGGGRTWAEESQALGVRLIREELPPGIILGLSRVRIDDPQRLSGWLLASEEYEKLVESYDEDWFRNPRAAEQWREQARVIPHTADSAALSRGRARLVTWLAENG